MYTKYTGSHYLIRHYIERKLEKKATSETGDVLLLLMSTEILYILLCMLWGAPHITKSFLLYNAFSPLSPSSSVCVLYIERQGFSLLVHDS